MNEVQRKKQEIQGETEYSLAPKWAEKKQGLELWFKKRFGDADPLDLFDVVIVAGNNDEYRPLKEQKGSILWLLQFAGIKTNTTFPLILPLDPEQGHEWVLEAFCEYGGHKSLYIDVPTCHPFIHNMIQACKAGGEVRITKKDELPAQEVVEMDMPFVEQWRKIIEAAFEERTGIISDNAPISLRRAIHDTIGLLDSGELRVAEKMGDTWMTNEWIKKAILLLFKVDPNYIMFDNISHYYDKVPLKFTEWKGGRFTEAGIRVVPGAIARWGSYMASGVILMPSFVNIGAYVGEGTMVDTWATVGSCAQIGKRCHISGGTGIGGVLEPLQANPTIIEDNCFIGARSEIVEGVIVEEGSVIGMGVYIGQSTKIYNRMTGEISYGRIPAGSVVVAGNLPSADGKYSLYCAVIIKQVDEKTRSKTSINELLRT